MSFLAYVVPSFAVILLIAAGVIAIALKARAPGAAVKAAIGLWILAFVRLVWLIVNAAQLYLILSDRMALSTAQVGLIFGVLNLVMMLIEMGGMSLLVVAVFAGRKPSARVVVPELPVVPGR